MRSTGKNVLTVAIGFGVGAFLCCVGGMGIGVFAPDSPPDTSPKPVIPTTTTDPSPLSTTASPGHTQSQANVYYRNCADVRAAGAAPLRPGDPGYRLGLDADKDGIACDK
jgi:hypothetical protein